MDLRKLTREDLRTITALRLSGKDLSGYTVEQLIETYASTFDEVEKNSKIHYPAKLCKTT